MARGCFVCFGSFFTSEIFVAVLQQVLWKAVYGFSVRPILRLRVKIVVYIWVGYLHALLQYLSGM